MGRERLKKVATNRSIAELIDHREIIARMDTNGPQAA
jgi:hypothetical protein